MNPPLPPSGDIIPSIRRSCKAVREAANIKIRDESIPELLLSPLFTSTFNSLSAVHGVSFPLKFPSIASELNVISVLSLLNFAHGYRLPLRKATGRGAYDSIRAFVLSLYLSSSDSQDLLSARGMARISSTQVAELMQLTDHVHQERSHPTIPGLVIGELGGPLHELVGLVTGVLNETGEILEKSGYRDLGGFVHEALKEGDRVGRLNGKGVDVEAILSQILKAIPAFRDMIYVNQQPVYLFKKALFLLHAIALRFGSSQPTPIPIPDTSTIPIFSDNVIPSMLVHLGILDLSESPLKKVFKSVDLQSTLAYTPPNPPDKNVQVVISEGPRLSAENSFILRAAAVDACEIIVTTAKTMEIGQDNGWIREISLPELDGWLWSVAKEGSLRYLERFAEPGTVFY